MTGCIPTNDVKENTCSCIFAKYAYQGCQNGYEYWHTLLKVSDNVNKRDFNYENLTENTKYFMKMIDGMALELGKQTREIEADKQLFAKGVTNIELSFETLTTESMSEFKADKPSSLVSDLGGQLGLWIGFSLASVVELIWWCFFMSCKGVCKRGDTVRNSEQDIISSAVE